MLPTGILGDIVSMQKSGIFVYREDKSQNLCNPEFCTFRLGLDKVSERVNYDHVGVFTRMMIQGLKNVSPKQDVL